MIDQRVSMTSLRLGLCVGVLGLLAATGCPAGDDGDDGETGAATTTGPTTMGMEETTATSAEDTTGSGSDLSHAADIQPIWDEHCVDACHEPGGQWGTFLDLTADAYDRIVDVAAPQFTDLDHIEPGNPSRSYIWHKINGTQVMAGGSGVMMPSARPGMDATVLTQDQLDTIEAWINAGAPR
jgi:hypothetical protein